jgi:hypothetical protein
MATQKSGTVQVSSSNANPFLRSPAANPFGGSFELDNPFAKRSDEVPADAPEGSYTYTLVQNGPAVASEEVETPSSAVEVVIKWGATVLHVEHLTPPRSFFVGDAEDKTQKCDFSLPA